MILEEDCKYSRKPHTNEYVKELLRVRLCHFSTIHFKEMAV